MGHLPRSALCGPPDPECLCLTFRVKLVPAALLVPLELVEPL